MLIFLCNLLWQFPSMDALQAALPSTLPMTSGIPAMDTVPTTLSQTSPTNAASNDWAYSFQQFNDSTSSSGTQILISFLWLLRGKHLFVFLNPPLFVFGPWLALVVRVNTSKTRLIMLLMMNVGFFILFHLSFALVIHCL